MQTVLFKYPLTKVLGALNLCGSSSFVGGNSTSGISGSILYIQVNDYGVLRLELLLGYRDCLL